MVTKLKKEKSAEVVIRIRESTYNYILKKAKPIKFTDKFDDCLRRVLGVKDE